MDKFKERLQTYGRYAFYFVTVLFIVSLVRNVLKIRKAGDRVDEARKRVEKLEAKNKELEEKLKVLQSDVYIEKQIRNGLGLAKEGEYVVVLPDDETLRSLAPSLVKDEDVLPDPNWRKWMNLFL